MHLFILVTSELVVRSVMVQEYGRVNAGNVENLTGCESDDLLPLLSPFKANAGYGDSPSLYADMLFLQQFNILNDSITGLKFKRRRKLLLLHYNDDSVRNISEVNTKCETLW